MTKRSAKEAAAAYLERREYSRGELQQKLSRRYAPGEIVEALDDLRAAGLQSDKRFVESYLRGAAAGYGREKIQAQLENYAVAPPLVADALASLSDETERARALVQQKYKNTKPAAERVWRFLQSRGFDGEVAEKVTEQFKSDDVE